MQLRASVTRDARCGRWLGWGGGTSWTEALRPMRPRSHGACRGVLTVLKPACPPDAGSCIAISRDMRRWSLSCRVQRPRPPAPGRVGERVDGGEVVLESRRATTVPWLVALTLLRRGHGQCAHSLHAVIGGQHDVRGWQPSNPTHHVCVKGLTDGAKLGAMEDLEKACLGASTR